MNNLTNENSIYLLQHADNPINWFPWGEEALQKAKTEDKPIFLSIGYAACHWCHVMEKETFVDPSVAVYMNKNFISIKVDREERPDLDKIYMDAVVALTGQGGWPLSVFLTPDGFPFYGGTYFPPDPRHGLPSFMQLVNSIYENWTSNRNGLLQQAETITNHIQLSADRFPSNYQLSESILFNALAPILQQVDWEKGGWGSSPKFPHPIVIDYLLLNTTNAKAEKAIKITLDRMIQGGMYDVVRGGFHRYSTDRSWRIPHFEKMLYDNAQLAKIYLVAGNFFENKNYQLVAENTLDFIKNELMDENGLFWSSIDADSDGEEGKFYIWDKTELVDQINKSGLSINQFDITPDNQLDGKVVLRFSSSNPDQQIHDIQHPLFTHLRSVQNKRNRPITDDKILIDWNALTIQTFVYAAHLLNRQDYRNIAVQAANQILSKFTVENRLRHSARNEYVGKSTFLSDYANLINAFLDLFYLEKDKKWYTEAELLSKDMIQLFYDGKTFFDTPFDHQLIIRPVTLEDNVIPSGGSAAIFALVRLNLINPNSDFSYIIQNTLTTNLGFISQYPSAAAYWLQAIHHWITPPQQLIAVIPDGITLDPDVFARLGKYNRVPEHMILITESKIKNLDLDLFRSKNVINNKTTFYLCKNHTCSPPTNSLEEILATP